MKVTVLVDTREKRPLKFPATIKWYRNRAAKGKVLLVRTASRTLVAGDYALEGYEETCIVERKGSLTELSNNLLGDDFSRADTAFRRLGDATAHPYLLLECSPAELRTKSKYVHEPGRVVDALCATLERYNFRLILCGRCNTIVQKRTVGEMILRLMLAHAYPEETEEDYRGVEGVVARLSRGAEFHGSLPSSQKDVPPKGTSSSDVVR